MKQEALIIFVRKPEKGKVKTRLAAALGNDAALAIYERLLQHTYAITRPLAIDKFVFYASELVSDDLWSEGYQKRMQTTGILGERMQAAFQEVFGFGYQRVCIIGSDCFALTTVIIEEAFASLRIHDVVIGPACDGGYYLLGMRDEVKPLFDGVEWSTNKVLRQTEAKLSQFACDYCLLPELNDVDTVDDVPADILLQVTGT